MRSPKAVLGTARQILLSLVVGGAVTGLLWVDTSAYLPKWVDSLVAVLFIPGMIVGFIAGSGRVHGANWSAVVISTAVFWTCLAYWFLRWRTSRANARSAASALRM